MYQVIFIPILFFLSSCQSALVDNIEKCRIEDTECQVKQFNCILDYLGDNGAPELDIPDIDPYKVTNFNINYLNLLNITLLEGYARGISDCKFQNYDLDVATGYGIMDVSCDVNIDGHYTFESVGLLPNGILGLGGALLHGDGNVVLNVTKLHLKFITKESVEKGDDGELHLKFKKNYTYDVDGFHINADNIMFGKIDITEIANKAINDNYKIVLAVFGRKVVDLAANIYYKYSAKLFAKEPAEKFIYKEDLDKLGKAAPGKLGLGIL